MQSFVQSPDTGRQIMVGGPAYQKLATVGVPVHTLPIIKEKKVRPVAAKNSGPSEDRMREIMAMELFEAPSMESLAGMATAPWKQRRFEQLAKHAGEGRGSRTRGWSLEQPQKGSQRHQLFNKCGQKCFLGDGEAFPICPSCDLYEGDCECRISCNGANAAFVRANQWNYPGVAEAAGRILKEKCGRNPKTGQRGGKRSGGKRSAGKRGGGKRSAGRRGKQW